MTSVMRATIWRQPDDLRAILDDPGPVEREAERLAGRRIVVVGTGTSWHAANHAVWLLREWSRRIARQAGRLVTLPVVLLGLAALDLIRLRAAGINWGGGAVVVLSLVLGLLGRVEQRGGLENLRVPEILRVDRL